MKKAILVLMALLLLTATCWAQGTAPKGQDVTMTGVMSCTFCNLPGWRQVHQGMLPELRESGRSGPLDRCQGQLYILLTGEQMKPLMTPERMDMLQSKVTVTGIVVKRGGLQAIYVKKMEKAK